MASFKNLTNSILTLSDERGTRYNFAVGETKDGLSNYFAIYTAAHSSSPLLKLVGDLDGDGSIPAPMSVRDNIIRPSGASSPYPKNAGDITEDDMANANSPVGRTLIFDNKNDEEYRNVKSEFVGVHAVPLDGSGDEPTDEDEFVANAPADITEGFYVTSVGKLFLVVGGKVYMFVSEDGGAGTDL